MPPHQITLTSKSGRVKLVPPSAADDEAEAILRTHPITRLYLRFLPEQFTTDDARIRREKMDGDPQSIYFTVYLQNNDGTTSFAGSAALMEIDSLNDWCTAGILVSPEYHREGIASEALYLLLTLAFEEKKFHRVLFRTGADNLKMQGWLENVLGAQQEFRYRECWKDGPGKYVDALGYAILDREWMGGMKARLEQRLNKVVVDPK